MPELLFAIHAAGWIPTAVTGAAGYLVIAAVVGVVTGRIIRNRDRQIPTAPKPEEAS